MKWAGYAVALVLLSIVITCSANQASIVVAAVEEGKKPSFGSTGADPFALEPLPYELDALEPYISKETLEYHHGKHLAAYVNNLNGCVQIPLVLGVYGLISRILTNNLFLVL